MSEQYLTFDRLLKSSAKLTPMMAQYSEIKKTLPDNTLLFFRMGDFYEVFFEDAYKAHEILHIARTHRGKIDEMPIPMAGIPHHSVANYIDRLTLSGLKVALCEQIEDPSQAKGIVKRKVQRIVGPGIPFDLELMDSNGQYLATAFFCSESNLFYLTLIDFGTGDFKGQIFQDEKSFIEGLKSYHIKEWPQYVGQWNKHQHIQDYIAYKKIFKTFVPQELFHKEMQNQQVSKILAPLQKDTRLSKHKGLFSALNCLILHILQEQSLESMGHLLPFKLLTNDQKLKVGHTTMEGLELVARPGTDYTDGILGIIDRTKTSMGRRFLKDLFFSPTLNKKELEKRFDFIDRHLENFSEIAIYQEELGKIKDINNILAKMTNKTFKTHDFFNLAQTIDSYQFLSKKFSKEDKIFLTLLKENENESIKDLSKIIKGTLDQTPGHSLQKGNLILPGVNKIRDKWAQLFHSGKEEIKKLEIEFKESSKISTLKIKQNNIAGYFVEVPKMQQAKVPKTFTHRQTLVNGLRYTCPELEDLQNKLNSSKYQLELVEKKIFEKIINSVKSHSEVLKKLSLILAKFDAFLGLTKMCGQENFTRPSFSEQSKNFQIKEAWHPLIKKNLNDKFITHNLSLTPNKTFGLITGPNMAGKTTVMREMAIIQYLSQIGCFVPAKQATIPIIDQIFSRLGAGDNISKGQSTFMVEMSETAEILRHATENSLILLDEIGRGTSTYDGLSIAWAIIEYIVTHTKCLTLFSTHYHELIKVIESLKDAVNLTVDTRTSHNKIEFLYTLKEGSTKESYGIHVAELAGLPEEVLKRSTNLLKSLETKQSHHQSEQKNKIKMQENTSDTGIDLSRITPEMLLKKIPFGHQFSFSFVDTLSGTSVSKKDSSSQLNKNKHLFFVEEEIRGLNINKITPIGALKKLSEMQKILLSKDNTSLSS